MNGIYSLHPLVHCRSRDSMSVEGRQTGFPVASTLLSSSITFRFTSEDLAYRRTLIPHIKALGNQSAYDVERYDKFGYWKETEELEVRVLDIRNVFEEDHPGTLGRLIGLQGWTG